jgi:pyruvate dehydrogenase phosphatase
VKEQKKGLQRRKCMMFSWLTRLVSSCSLRPNARMNKDIENDFDVSEDALVWCKDLEKHSCGEFSFAIVQANEVIEDHSQVETGSDSVFVGVYDGHGGPDASRFVNDHLFNHLISEFSCEISLSLIN